MNEHFLAVKKRKNEIEIYEIQKNEAFGKIFCTVNPSCSIEDFKLNPNYLNILLIANYQKILFFNINEAAEKKVIVNPEFIFNKNVSEFSSIVFNPHNSHTVACSCFDHTIQV